MAQGAIAAMLIASAIIAFEQVLQAKPQPLGPLGWRPTSNPSTATTMRCTERSRRRPHLSAPASMI
jgi:hypothetical protein